MSQEALALPLPTSGEVAFTVHGHPEPAGSKRSVPMGQRWGVIDANPKSKGWKLKVEQVAGEIMQGRALFRGAVELRLTFFVQRPKGHYGRKGLLPSAAPYPIVKPDVLKLARGVEDALTGVIYTDDALIVNEILAKRYGPERVEITVREVLP